MQFRYYGRDDGRNCLGSNNNYNTLVGGNIFSNYKNISKLGIQGIPGIQFTLNDSAYFIEIGETGIYELDLEGYGVINKIKFNDSINSIGTEGDTSRLLIDIVYEGSDN